MLAAALSQLNCVDGKRIRRVPSPRPSFAPNFAFPPPCPEPLSISFAPFLTRLAGTPAAWACVQLTLTPAVTIFAFHWVASSECLRLQIMHRTACGCLIGNFFF